MAKDWVALETLFPTYRQPPSDGVVEPTAPKNGFFNKVRNDKKCVSVDPLGSMTRFPRKFVIF